MSTEERYRTLMGVTMCAFNWSADQFWRSTAHELYALFEARQRENDRINAIG